MRYIVAQSSPLVAAIFLLIGCGKPSQPPQDAPRQAERAEARSNYLAQIETRLATLERLRAIATDRGDHAVRIGDAKVCGEVAEEIGKIDREVTDLKLKRSEFLAR